MKNARVVAGLVVVVLVVVGLALPVVEGQKKPLTIRLGVHTSIMGAADVIAIRQGYFKQEGLDVEARRFALGKEGRDAMIAGAINRVLEDFCKYDPLPFMLTVTNKAIQEKPDAVVAYLRAWLRAVALLKEEPVKAAAIYTEEQRSVGRDVEVAVIDKSLRRIRWEPEITPKMEKYLVDQAKDLTTGAGEGRLKAVPDVAKALNRDLLKKAMAAR